MWRIGSGGARVYGFSNVADMLCPKKCLAVEVECFLPLQMPHFEETNHDCFDGQ